VGLVLRVGETMSYPIRTVEINRITLTGLQVTPERAERIRAMVALELQRLLERGRLPEDLASGEVSHLNAPTMHVGRPHSDGQLADGLARSIVRSLRGPE
jgi:hypothetical protein